MKLLLLTFTLLALCSCGTSTTTDNQLNSGPYDKITLDFSATSEPLALETVRHVEAILAAENIEVEVLFYQSEWETFNDITLLQYFADSTVFIGIRPDDYLVEYADGSYGPFNGCYHWYGASLAAINYRSVSPKSLAVLILHEVAHSCGWNGDHEGNRFDFLQDCFYGDKQEEIRQ